MESDLYSVVKSLYSTPVSVLYKQGLAAANTRQYRYINFLHRHSFRRLLSSAILGYVSPGKEVISSYLHHFGHFADSTSFHRQLLDFLQNELGM
jgi:hypothetical protein